MCCYHSLTVDILILQCSFLKSECLKTSRSWVISFLFSFRLFFLHFFPSVLLGVHPPAGVPTFLSQSIQLWVASELKKYVVINRFFRRHSGLKNIENKGLNQMKIVSLLVTATASQDMRQPTKGAGTPRGWRSRERRISRVRSPVSASVSALLGVSSTLRQAPPVVLQDVSVEPGASRLLLPSSRGERPTSRLTIAITPNPRFEFYWP